MFLFLRSKIRILNRPVIDTDIQWICRKCPLQLILSNPCFSETQFGEYCAREMVAGAIEHPNLFQIVRVNIHSRHYVAASSGAQSASDQIALIVAQTFWKRVQLEPFGSSDFKIMWKGDSFWIATKDYLHLPIFLKSANEGDARNLDFEADLFTQLAADSPFGLLSRMHEPAGNAPSAAGAKAVLKQQ